MYIVNYINDDGQECESDLMNLNQAMELADKYEGCIIEVMDPSGIVSCGCDLDDMGMPMCQAWSVC